MNLDAHISARIQSFVSELSALVRQAALESVESALGQPLRTRGERRAGHDIGNGAAASPKRARKGGKRDPKDLARLVDAVRAHISEHPGEGVEQIAKHLGVPSKAIKLPVAKLLAEKAIRKTGQKRATKYFAR